MINFGVSTTITKDRSISEALNAIGKSPFKWVEIRCDPGHFNYEDGKDIKEIQKNLRRNQIKASSLHPPGWVDIACSEEWTRMKSVREVEKTILVAEHLKVPIVIVHPGYKDGSLNQAEKSLKEIVEFSHEWKVNPILENTFPGYFGSEPKTLMYLAAKFDLSICLDTSHAAAEVNRIEEFLKLLGSRIRHFHLSDSNMEGNDDHLIPFEGKINWIPIMEFTNEFDGFIIFEILPAKCPEKTLALLDKIRNNWRSKKITP